MSRVHTHTGLGVSSRSLSEEPGPMPGKGFCTKLEQIQDIGLVRGGVACEAVALLPCCFVSRWIARAHPHFH